MKKLIIRLSEYWERHKNERYFKAKVLIAVLIVMVAAVKSYDNYRTDKELAAAETSVSAEAEEEEPITFEKILGENKAHIIIFTGLTAALAAVKLRNKHRIKESK